MNGCSVQTYYTQMMDEYIRMKGPQHVSFFCRLIQQQHNSYTEKLSNIKQTNHYYALLTLCECVDYVPDETLSTSVNSNKTHVTLTY